MQKDMVKELIFIQMEIDMLASGKIMKNMVVAHISMQMEEVKYNITDLIITNLYFLNLNNNFFK